MLMVTTESSQPTHDELLMKDGRVLKDTMSEAGMLHLVILIII